MMLNISRFIPVIITEPGAPAGIAIPIHPITRCSVASPAMHITRQRWIMHIAESPVILITAMLVIIVIPQEVPVVKRYTKRQ